MKKSQKGSVMLWVTILIVVLVVVSAFYYSKNKPSGSGDQGISQSSIPEYVFSKDLPPKLSKILLSHNKVEINSPWGKESNYQGSTDGTLSKYTFANGVQLAIILNKDVPQDSIKKLGLTNSELNEYDALFRFISSKIGEKFSSYDYELFLHMTTQKTVDNATSKQDKESYSKVLSLKNILSLGLDDTVYGFSNSYVKGFVWVAPNSDIPSAIDFWGANGWKYTIIISKKQDVTRGEIEALMKSINPNL